jgi:hypothetical protein
MIANNVIKFSGLYLFQRSYVSIPLLGTFSALTLAGHQTSKLRNKVAGHRTNEVKQSFSLHKKVLQTVF